jgi:hypothetical protein
MPATATITSSSPVVSRRSNRIDRRGCTAERTESLGDAVAATLGIYLVALVVCLVTGIAVQALIFPSGRWVSACTLPLGACTAMALLYPLGYGLTTTAAAPIYAALVLLTLGTCVIVRLRRTNAGWRSGLRASLVPTWTDGLTIVTGLVVGILLLLPVLRAGFPTTISIGNNDGWGYATLVDWLVHHPFPRQVPPDIAHPLTFVPFSQERDSFGVGFERIAALVTVLLRRASFETVLPVAALAPPIAVCGWTTLWRAVGGRAQAAAIALVGLGVLSPLFVLPFADNYLTQFFSIGLWPFAIASFLRFAATPRTPRLVVAALGTAGIVGVYPALLPWLLAGLVAVAAMSGWRAADVSGLRRRGLGTALHGGGLLLALAVAVTVLAPLQVQRAVHNLSFVGGKSGNPGFPRFDVQAYGASLTGAVGPYSFLGGAPIAWSAAAAALVSGAAIALAFAGPYRGGGKIRRSRRELALIVALPIALTAAVVLNYVYRDPYGYGALKGLITGGAILAGFVVCLLLLPARLPALGFGLLGAVLGIWALASGSELQSMFNGRTGFRADDVALGRELRHLPPRAVVLVEGAAEDGSSFQLRMVASYMGGAYAHRDLEGLGSTASYLTPGGLATWRPRTPWSYVVQATPTPFGSGRSLLWRDPSYSVSAAPRLDATPYGHGWYPTEQQGTASLAWTSGPVELVLSNRASRARRAILGMSLGTNGVARRVSLSWPGGASRTVVSPGRGVQIRTPVTVPAGSTLPVTLTPSPGASPAPPGDPRLLAISVSGVRLSPA